jgi:hypothetical protein
MASVEAVQPDEEQEEVNTTENTPFWM